MGEIDFDRVNTLLSVVHQCATVGPQLTSISAAAMEELTALNAQIKEDAKPKAAPVAAPAKEPETEDEDDEEETEDERRI